jgi:hypothetical protein
VAGLSRLLGRKNEAPWGLRASAYFLTMATTWAALGVAGVRFTLTLVCGAAAGLVAELIVEAWWLRRERRRDLASGYAAGRQNREA